MENLKIAGILENLDNIEDSDSKGLFDLTLEAQVRFLEFFKRFKDIEKGKYRGKGFGNCWKLNSKRDPKVFTYLEAQFDRLARDSGLELKHEVRIKVKDRTNKSHIFKLDFFDPSTRIDIEVSPNWHKNYRIVERRDALRKMLLRKVGIRSYTVPVVSRGKLLRINGALAQRVINATLKANPSRNSLEFYFRGVN